MATRVTGISGSLSDDSYTLKALHIALEGARESGSIIDVIDLRELPLPFCDGRPSARYPENVQILKHKIQDSQGIILASPEYHSSFSAVLKNALDLLSKDEMEGKMCGLIGIAGGNMAANAVNSLRIVCRSVGAWVVPHHVVIGNVDKVFDSNGVISDKHLIERLTKLGNDVAKYARLHFPND